MSKKKWRRAANPGYVPPVADAKKDVKPEAQPTVQAGTGDVAAKSAEAGPVPEAPRPFVPYDLNVSDDEAQGFINEMTRFLGGVVRRTNILLGRVSFPGFRHVVAGDLPDTQEPAETIEAAEKKLPRSHPLMGLIRYALAASRLLNRILVTTKPHLFGRPSNAYKNLMHAAQASEKFLKGRVPPEAMRDAVGQAGIG